MSALVASCVALIHRYSARSWLFCDNASRLTRIRVAMARPYATRCRVYGVTEYATTASFVAFKMIELLYWF